MSEPKTATQIVHETREREKLLQHAQMYGVGVAKLRAGLAAHQSTPAEVQARLNRYSQEDALLTARWSVGNPNMQNLFKEQAERARVRSMVIDEFSRLIVSIEGPEHARLRGVFTHWWGEYRNANHYVYSDDEALQTHRVAEVRIGFAKCIEAVREREKRLAERRAKREHDRATYGRQHR